MDNTLNVKVGDTVAVLVLRNALGGYEPNRLEIVRKVTPKRINGEYDLEGRCVVRGSSRRLSTDPEIIAKLQAKVDRELAARQERERQEAERDARPSYQLACRIVRQVDSSKAIADLELLGEEYLEQVLLDIATAKRFKQ